MRYLGRFEKLVALLAMAVVLSLTAACGAAATATPVPPTNTPTQVAETTPAWQMQWDETMAKAKQEGEVVIVMGGSASRNFAPLFDDFNSQTGIKVTAVTGRGSQQVEKLAAERDAGIYSSDIWMTGVTSTNNAKEAGIVGPLPDGFLIDPAVADPMHWQDGHLWFADAPKDGNANRDTTLAFCASPSPQFAYNTDLVDPSTLTSYWDLIDGRFDGQMVGTLPWEPGQTNSDFYINNPDLGEPFIKKFLTEADVLWVADGQQAVDLLSNGAKKVFVYEGNANQDIDDLEAQGLPVKNHFGQGFKEGGVVSVGGTCAMAVIDHPKDPAAAQIFVNWWLGESNLHKAQGITNDQSLRVDVPADNIDAQYIRPANAFFPEMDDSIVPNVGLEYNQKIADEYGLR